MHATDKLGRSIVAATVDDDDQADSLVQGLAQAAQQQFDMLGLVQARDDDEASRRRVDVHLHIRSPFAMTVLEKSERDSSLCLSLTLISIS